MKNENKKNINIKKSSINGYHGGDFESYKYFTSDRWIALNHRFERADGKPLKGYGLEIETECNGVIARDVLAEIYEKIIFTHFPADLFKMERDGSLGGRTSAECITQIMTKEAIRNMYPAFKAMYNTYFPTFHITCTSGRCGMHVNVSNACFGGNQENIEESIRKLCYFVNHHFKFCCYLFNRDLSNTYYCNRMAQMDDKDYCKTFNIHSMPSAHCNSINGSHYDHGRIEIRLVGGQKDYGCFRNTMESVFFLVERLKKVSWNDLDKPEKVFIGCNQYVYDRIRSKCYQGGTITVEQLNKIATEVKQEPLF